MTAAHRDGSCALVRSLGLWLLLLHRAGLGCRGGEAARSAALVAAGTAAGNCSCVLSAEEPAARALVRGSGGRHVICRDDDSHAMGDDGGRRRWAGESLAVAVGAAAAPSVSGQAPVEAGGAAGLGLARPGCRSGRNRGGGGEGGGGDRRRRRDRGGSGSHVRGSPWRCSGGTRGCSSYVLSASACEVLSCG